ncbi:MAG: dTDP-glucose 4,6-dehydratase [Deltaproteobacteria bacterium]|nr:dTDP-glucose 4,6-dehydratase [Deltaproteobacteria bacterium]
MRLLVTGGAGFIGSSFIRYLSRVHPDYRVVNLDKLTYAADLEGLREVEGRSGYAFVRGDICELPLVEELIGTGVDAIVNFAAESHVDRSILEPAPFIRTNLVGTHVLLEGARRGRVARFVQVSTDEVYGSLGPEERATESTPPAPGNPYSASKAGADLLARAYARTYGMDVVITRCSNNYGPYQHPEKLIPTLITRALEGRPLPLYGDGLYVRDWIYVEDHCQALDLVLHRGRAGELYNIGAGNERTNLEVAELILKILGGPPELIAQVEDRPGHDRRYAMDSSKLAAEMGWTPHTAFEDGLRLTIEWYRQHEAWWRRLRRAAGGPGSG